MTSLFTLSTRSRGQINPEPYSRLFLDMKYESRTTFNPLTIVYPWALDTIVSFIILTFFSISFGMQIFDTEKKKRFFLSVANRVDKIMWMLVWLTRYVSLDHIFPNFEWFVNQFDFTFYPLIYYYLYFSKINMICI